MIIKSNQRGKINPTEPEEGEAVGTTRHLGDKWWQRRRDGSGRENQAETQFGSRIYFRRI